LQSASTDMNSCPKPRPPEPPELTIASQACTNISPKKSLRAFIYQKRRNILSVPGPLQSACWARILACFGPFQAPRFRIEYLFRRGRSFAPGLPAAVFVLDSAGIQDLRRGDFSVEVARGYLSHLALPSSIHTMLISATPVRPQPCTG
jgi:hypothetical protein